MDDAPLRARADERTAAAEDEFRELVEPHRVELHAHCYRMLGSVHDAEDALQETMVRAWRGLARFEGRSSLRAWLYRIATNVCLTALEQRPKRALPVDLSPAAAAGEMPGDLVEGVRWLGPYPDRRMGLPSGAAGPEARYELRESVELAFVAALQHLPATQRAALIVRDVLGFSAREAAGLLGTTTAAVNSALQHARDNVRSRIPERSQQATLRELGDRRVDGLVRSFTEAMGRGDVDAMVGLLTEDAVWSMPPLPQWYRGHAAIAEFLVAGPFTRRWRHLPATANGQPAVGSYLWEDDRFRAFALDVLTVRDGSIAGITAFLDPPIFADFGLPDTVEP
ncbi:sigma-70 family RNA polymerase sigma factor [Nocardia wallacei]|uniref:sigma-70 family RNA polymerase sigma factor n=1 Tax=Nocardia wallacei TaxID=480035 RepID=UPI0024552B7F|nr:sigma-70 family RNA polymerase sigma factor [Nocardia wallacei]